MPRRRGTPPPHPDRPRRRRASRAAIVAGTIAASLTVLSAPLARASHPTPTIVLEVDARAAPRRIVHAHLSIPAAPGPLALLYPKWVPGEHGPTGPVGQIADLTVVAAGHPLAWRRDPLDLYRFTCVVPPGVAAVEVSFDYLAPSSGGRSEGASMTDQLAHLSWNQLLVYPEGPAPLRQRWAASLRLPDGWSHASSLVEQGDAAAPGRITFEPVDLETLVDSPVMAGRNARVIPLGRGREIDLFADGVEALDVPAAWGEGVRRLVRETEGLFGGAGYEGYHFLVALSDNVAHYGLEHRASSSNLFPERALLDADASLLWTRVMPHELVHAWNGKDRRPARQVTRDFQQPCDTSLLWVYEGLTAYLGDVLGVRAGMWTDALLRGRWAQFAAVLADETGRASRSLADTSVAAPLARGAPAEWASRRRELDFYPEGELLWLEVDTRIRQQSGGTRSLDDFCRAFFGGARAGVPVRTYVRSDLIAALARIAPYDWTSFFDERVDRTTTAAPTGGFTVAGWRLEFGAEENEFTALARRVDGMVELRSSLGMEIDDDGAIVDVVAGSPADRGGLAPGERLIAVDERRYRPELLLAALARADASSPTVELLVRSGDFYRAHRVEAVGGPRFPRLVRDGERADLLDGVLRPGAGRFAGVRP